MCAPCRIILNVLAQTLIIHPSVVKCGFCSIAVMNTTEEEVLTEATPDFVTDLSIYQSTINLYSS